MAGVPIELMGNPKKDTFPLIGSIFFSINMGKNYIGGREQAVKRM
jgi:hypothetical protein